jgi:hypothetical protein
MRLATRTLRDEMAVNSQLAARFTDNQFETIKSGKASIPGLTWHHHQDTGRMQLIPRDIHSDTGHIGGDAMINGQ